MWIQDRAKERQLILKRYRHAARVTVEQVVNRDAAVIESGESCRAVLGVILAAVPGSLLGR